MPDHKVIQTTRFLLPRPLDEFEHQISGPRAGILDLAVFDDSPELITRHRETLLVEKRSHDQHAIRIRKRTYVVAVSRRIAMQAVKHDKQRTYAAVFGTIREDVQTCAGK